MVMGWAGLLWFIGSWIRALGGGWGWLRWAGLGWARLVCGFVGSWVALGFVWVSFSRLIAGVETRDPRTCRTDSRGGSRGGIRAINTIYYGEILRGAGRGMAGFGEASAQ